MADGRSFAKLVPEIAKAFKMPQEVVLGGTFIAPSTKSDVGGFYFRPNSNRTVDYFCDASGPIRLKLGRGLGGSNAQATDLMPKISVENQMQSAVQSIMEESKIDKTAEQLVYDKTIYPMTGQSVPYSTPNRFKTGTTLAEMASTLQQFVGSDSVLNAT